MSNNTDVARLILSTPFSETAEEPRDAWNAAGMSKDAVATTNNDDDVCAAFLSFAPRCGCTVILKLCSLRVHPPKKKHIPNTSNKFDNIDPRSDA